MVRYHVGVQNPTSCLGAVQNFMMGVMDKVDDDINVSKMIIIGGHN